MCLQEGCLEVVLPGRREEMTCLGGLGGRKKLGIFVNYFDLIVALLRLYRQGYS